MSVERVRRFVTDGVILLLGRIHFLEGQFVHAVTSMNSKQAVVILSCRIAFPMPPISLPCGNAFLFFKEERIVHIQFEYGYAVTSVCCLQSGDGVGSGFGVFVVIEDVFIPVTNSCIDSIFLDADEV